MLARIFCCFVLIMPLFVALSGCDNSPKIVMPTAKAPPAPPVMVSGGGPGQPVAPDVELKEEPAKPEDKK